MKIIVTLILLLFALGTAFPQTVVSTAAGGNWADTTTWVGHVLPTAADDVVINGTVYANSAYVTLECKNLTVNAGDTLSCSNFGTYGVLLFVNGNINNNGVITQSDFPNSSSDFGISVKGNIINNGKLQNRLISFDADTAQTLTSVGAIRVRELEMKNGQDLLAGSDLSFVDSYFQFNNGKFVVDSSFTVAFYSTEGGTGNGHGRVDKAHFTGGGKIFSAGIATPNVYWFNDSTSVENVRLTGVIRGKGNFAILGGVVNEDTLQQAENNYSVTIHAFEDFTNKGLIRDNPTDNDFLDFTLHKNFTNYGRVTNSYLTFAGADVQTIYSYSPIEANYLVFENGGSILAGSNLEFLNVNWFNASGEFIDFVAGAGDTLAFVRSSDDNTIIRKVHFKGGGILFGKSFKHGRIQLADSTSVENLTLTGCLSGKNNFRILSNVINKDTLQGGGNQYGDKIIVEEDFINNGVVRGYPFGNSVLSVYVKKNVKNNGLWENYLIVMDGESDQTFLNAGNLKSCFNFKANVPGATSFQWFKNGVAINGATDETYKYYYDSGNPQNYDPYGEYYCRTDKGNSRLITVKNGNGANGNGVILTENFDGTVFPPTGWTRSVYNSAKTWFQGNPANHPFTDVDSTNVHSALCPWVGEDQDEWLITPAVKLPDDGILLRFYAGFSTNWLSAATLKAHISTDGGSNWTEIWEASDDSAGWKWREINVDLSGYKNNSNVLIAWQYVGNNGDLAAIDDVSLTFGLVGVEEEAAEAPDNFELNQNYPNPFNPTTIISYKLPKREFVSLTVYNLLGEKVAGLVNKIQEAGNHKINFHASRLASGVYIYRIKAGSFVKSRKMMLLK